MPSDTALEVLLRRDRIVVLSGLIAIVVLAWLSMSLFAWSTPSMEMTMPHRHLWSGLDFALMCMMWVVMMIAMMVPSAAPTLLMYATMSRRHRERATPFAPTGVFLLGYLVVWAGFSVLATLAQWGLYTAALLSSEMGHTGPALGGGLLLAAGIFQWTPLKTVCLTHCRSPLGFFMTHWRDGVSGAFAMGARHGSYCLGCCWVLMLLLFAAGVMHVLWMATLTVFVLVEKVVPRGDRVGRVAGGILVLAGLFLLGRALL